MIVNLPDSRIQIVYPLNKCNCDVIFPLKCSEVGLSPLLGGGVSGCQDDRRNIVHTNQPGQVKR